MNGMGGVCSTYGEKRGAYRGLVGTSNRKRPLGSPRNRFEDNINKVIQEVGLEGVDWIDLAQDGDMFLGHANAVINFRVP
jgi:hypothetical protein